MREKWGKWAARVGGATLLLVVGITGWSAITNRPKCEGPLPAGYENRALAAKPGKFGANGQLCVAWRPDLYFKPELDARKALDAELTLAKASEEVARKAAETDKTATDRFKATQTIRQAVETKISTLPSSATIAVFIDNVETSAAFKAPIPKSDTPKPVLWRAIPLRAPEDSASAAAKDWRDLLQGIGRDGSRDVKVAFGDKKAELPRAGAEVDNLKISAFERLWLIAGAVGFLLLVTGLVMLGWESALLRVAPVVGTDNPPFSLARVQMAWWFSLTLGGFLFIWLTSAQWMGVMTPGVLALLGISGVSGLASIAIDLETGTTPLAKLPSKGFWKDILSDGQSMVLHRVQMLTWTVVLGLVFLWSVVWNYAFPTFDTNLLILAGLVNGVYLGFKFPENKK